MGRKPGISSAERMFRESFAQALRSAIGTARGGGTVAANRMGVSRQAISLYLKLKATPSAEVIRKACSAFGLTVTPNGELLALSGPQPIQRQEKLPRQLPLLPEAIESLTSDQLDVQILRKLGDSVHLEVKINFRKRSG